ETGDAGEDVVLAPELAEYREAEARALEVLDAGGRLDNAIGIRHGQGLEQDAVDQSENRGVHADAKGERDYGDAGKSGASDQASTGGPGVLRGLFEPDEGTLVAVELPGLLHAAEGAPSREPRLFGRHALASKLVCKQREMRRDFSGQVAF